MLRAGGGEHVDVLFEVKILDKSWGFSANWDADTCCCNWGADPSGWARDGDGWGAEPSAEVGDGYGDESSW